MTETQSIAADSVAVQAPNWVKDMYAPVDALDVHGFISHLTDDVSFRFGNAEASNGKQAVAQGLTQFFGAINGMKHNFREVWEHGDDAVLVIDVDYTRRDGDVVRLPAATLVHRRGGLVDKMQIIIDVGPAVS